MRNRILLCGVILMMSGCASKNPNLSITADITLKKEDLREIHEAFKNSTQEKRIGLNENREAVCAYTQCGFSITDEGPVENPMKDGEKAKLSGYLIFTKKSTTVMLEMMDRARGFGKDQTTKGPKGQTTCGAKACTMTFSLKEKQHISADQLCAELPEENP